MCDIACSLVPCLGHHLAFLKCVPIHDSLAHTLQIPSLDDKCYPHPPSWHCLRLCRHLFHVQTCTHLCETIATCNIHFLFRSVSYTWQRLICPKRHKSKYPSCLFDHRLTKKACKHKPIDSLDNNSVQGSEGDGEMKMMIVSLHRVIIRRCCGACFSVSQRLQLTQNTRQELMIEKKTTVVSWI